MQVLCFLQYRLDVGDGGGLDLHQREKKTVNGKTLRHPEYHAMAQACQAALDADVFRHITVMRHDEDLGTEQNNKSHKSRGTEGPAGWRPTSQTTPHDILAQELPQYRHSQS